MTATHRRPAQPPLRSRRPLHVVVTAVVVGGTAVVAGTLLLTDLGALTGTDGLLGSTPLPVWLLAAGLLLGELGPIPVARGDERTGPITVSTVCALALVATGPLALLLVVHLLAVGLDDVRTRREPVKAAFNAGQYALSLVAARLVFCLVAGVDLTAPYTTFTGAVLPATLLAGVAFVLLNNGLVAVVVALANDLPVGSTLASDLVCKMETSLVLVGLAPVAALLAQASPWLLPLMVLPLVALRRSAVLAAARRKQALRDPLTGLGNRDLFFTRTARQVVHTELNGEPLTVLMLDLDHFKDINDTLGHQIGDQVIQEVGRRIGPAADEPGCVARLGGDEFAVLLPGLSVEAAGDFAQNLLSAIGRPLQIGGTRFAIQASIGIAAAEPGIDVTTLMQRADIALYEAKRERARWCLYDDTCRTATPERLSLLADLREAVALGRLSVFFQPQVSLVDGRVCGTEALARWTHPERGVIEPEEFIALAENAGLISQVTDLVLEDALRALDGWNRAGLASGVSVNISARQLSDLGLPERIVSALARHDIEPYQLTVEVTESSMMGDPRRAGEILRELRRVGVRVAVDDFGTGYSSLAYLQSLDLDEIKVDRSFVHSMRVAGQRTGDDVLVRSIIELGHNLGLSVVAEGVESTDQIERLRELGCDVVQGYHLGRPMDRELMTGWLQREALIAPSRFVAAMPPTRTVHLQPVATTVDA